MRLVPPALLAASALAGPAGADGCRLALVLAIDVSSSVDAEEDRLQREGLARALLAPEVVRAFLAGDPVALHAFEWSGQRTQVPFWPGWVMVEDEPTLERLAATIAGSPRSTDELPTAVGAALARGAIALRDGPDCRARTIDVAGDGFHNEGFGPDLAYREFPFTGVTVNALVIGGSDFEAELVRWFEAEVMRGPGAFVEVAEGYGDYARAMERKLLRELGLPAVSGTPEGDDAG
ncbi:DUF1194 domain-containing protein [Rubellimicrobium roseum]|uniref:DUF1194 domain-containing protein n=1 Tax=Rubellimicrobium roseum TaxID=687525 RepID=UPI002699AF85